MTIFNWDYKLMSSTLPNDVNNYIYTTMASVLGVHSKFNIRWRCVNERRSKVAPPKLFCGNAVIHMNKITYIIELQNASIKFNAKTQCSKYLVSEPFTSKIPDNETRNLIKNTNTFWLTSEFQWSSIKLSCSFNLVVWIKQSQN